MKIEKGAVRIGLPTKWSGSYINCWSHVACTVSLQVLKSMMISVLTRLVYVHRVCTH